MWLKALFLFQNVFEGNSKFGKNEDIRLFYDSW